MAEKKLMRSKEHKLAGVCGGIANYFGWDANIVRIVYALLSIFTAFCGVLLYLILWLILPEEK